jgi:hypothetical protein
VTPVLHGAVSKIVRTKSCKPRSGNRFRVGKTVVKCTAADTSGNVATAAFKITVKR